MSEKHITDAKINGKRLLVLGGSYCKDAIKDFAMKNNISLIVAGNDPNAGICEIADEYYNVDSTDSEAMKKILREKKIDGVYLGSSEPVISAAISYVTEMGFPCYCTKKQWDTLQNKLEFKKLCAKNGLPIVPNYIIDESNIKLAEKEFPVITKPADGCGSSNFSVCKSNAELIKGYFLAKEGSASKKVIVEKFVKNDSVVVFYTFSDGKMYFSGIEDKYPVLFEAQGSYVVGLLIFKSIFTNEFREKFENKIQKMLKSIGIREGNIWIEVFHDGEDYYFNEAGYRYGGSVSIYPINYLYGINQLASDINFSLLGQSKIFGHESLISEVKSKKNNYCVYPLYLKPGTIGAIEGIEIISEMKNVIAVPEIKKIGDVIISTGTVSQTFTYIHFVFDSIEECKAIIDKIHRTVKVLDRNGNNLVEKKLDFDLRNIEI